MELLDIRVFWLLMSGDVEAAAKPLRPALEELIRQAAQGSVMHNDDTGMAFCD